MEFAFIKLEIFIPASHLEPLRTALQSVDAGHIGAYDCCMSYSPVVGTWRPLEGTHPFLGTVGELCESEELKVEVSIRAENLHRTIEAIRAVHPYEEPVINALPLLEIGICL